MLILARLWMGLGILGLLGLFLLFLYSMASSEEQAWIIYFGIPLTGCLVPAAAVPAAGGVALLGLRCLLERRRPGLADVGLACLTVLLLLFWVSSLLGVVPGLWQAFTLENIRQVRTMSGLTGTIDGSCVTAAIALLLASVAAYGAMRSVLQRRRGRVGPT
jgi:hypothetical protein